MTALLLITALGAAIGPGPAAQPPAGSARPADLETMRWTIDGVERTALVHLPPKPAEGKTVGTKMTHPLVFVFHGHGGSSRNAARSFHIHTLWPEAIVVYPQGLPTPGALTDPEGRRNGWQNRPGVKDDRDLKFFDAMLARFKADHAADGRRIYSTGHSNGGAFTYLLAVARPGVFAAIAPSSAVAVPARRAGLPPAEPLPVFHVAGRADPLVKFAWQERTLAALRALNGCAAEGTPWPGGKAATEYKSPGGTPVVAYLHDGGHTFPAAAPALIVAFLQQHTRPEPPKPPGN